MLLFSGHEAFPPKKAMSRGARTQGPWAPKEGWSRWIALSASAWPEDFPVNCQSLDSTDHSPPPQNLFQYCGGCRCLDLFRTLTAGSCHFSAAPLQSLGITAPHHGSLACHPRPPARHCNLSYPVLAVAAWGSPLNRRLFSLSMLKSGHLLSFPSHGFSTLLAARLCRWLLRFPDSACPFCFFATQRVLKPGHLQSLPHHHLFSHL